MIKFENTEVLGWEHAIRGMRNPMNSWEKSDSGWKTDCTREHLIVDSDTEGYFELGIGPNDRDLMMRLRNAGTDHRKFMRMITVYVDITAPLYWWKEFDTYKVGTVANSCSTMHKITAKEFTLEDFSCEHLIEDEAFAFPLGGGWRGLDALEVLKCTIEALNNARKRYLTTKDKKYWWQMIQLLPSSYNQKRTVMLNYEVLANVYKSRKNHKLDEWVEFCKWIETLPYSDLITGTTEISQEVITPETAEFLKKKLNCEEMIKNATGLDGYSIRIEDDTIIREKEAVWTPEKIRSLGIPYPCDMEEFKKACEKVMEENDETADDLKDLIAYLAVVHDPICHLCDKKKQRSTTSEECLKCPFYAYAVFK